MAQQGKVSTDVCQTTAGEVYAMGKNYHMLAETGQLSGEEVMQLRFKTMATVATGKFGNAGYASIDVADKKHQAELAECREKWRRDNKSREALHAAIEKVKAEKQEPHETVADLGVKASEGDGQDL